MGCSVAPLRSLLSLRMFFSHIKVLFPLFFAFSSLRRRLFLLLFVPPFPLPSLSCFFWKTPHFYFLLQGFCISSEAPPSYFFSVFFSWRRQHTLQRPLFLVPPGYPKLTTLLSFPLAGSAARDLVVVCLFHFFTLFSGFSSLLPPPPSPPPASLFFFPFFLEVYCSPLFH